jgi:hypothetical protein
VQRSGGRSKVDFDEGIRVPLSALRVGWIFLCTVVESLAVAVIEDEVMHPLHFSVIRLLQP